MLDAILGFAVVFVVGSPLVCLKLYDFFHRRRNACAIWRTHEACSHCGRPTKYGEDHHCEDAVRREGGVNG